MAYPTTQTVYNSIPANLTTDPAFLAWYKRNYKQSLAPHTQPAMLRALYEQYQAGVEFNRNTPQPPPIELNTQDSLPTMEQEMRRGEWFKTLAPGDTARMPEKGTPWYNYIMTGEELPTNPPAPSLNIQDSPPTREQAERQVEWWGVRAPGDTSHWPERGSPWWNYIMYGGERPISETTPEPTPYKPPSTPPSGANIPLRGRMAEDWEQRQRQIYSYRDRIQPPKMAQPSTPSYKIEQPEGRPAKYQYTQYERKPYNWLKRGQFNWW